MTQENKFEYISEVIQELINECEKEGVAMILQATDNEGFAASGIVGSLPSVGRNLIVQEQIIQEKLEMPIELIKILGAAESCNCDKCKKRNEKVSTDSYGNENK